MKIYTMTVFLESYSLLTFLSCFLDNVTIKDNHITWETCFDGILQFLPIFKRISGEFNARLEIGGFILSADGEKKLSDKCNQCELLLMGTTIKNNADTDRPI